MDVEEFLLTAVHRSKLDPFKDEIFLLVEKGVSYRKIRKFLALNGVATSTDNIYGYIKRRQKTRPATQQKKPADAALPQPITAEPPAPSKPMQPPAETKPELCQQDKEPIPEVPKKKLTARELLSEFMTPPEKMPGYISPEDREKMYAPADPNKRKPPEKEPITDSPQKKMTAKERFKDLLTKPEDMPGYISPEEREKLYAPADPTMRRDKQ